MAEGSETDQFSGGDSGSAPLLTLALNEHVRFRVDPPGSRGPDGEGAANDQTVQVLAVL
jgi:hypothetical protein